MFDCLPDFVPLIQLLVGSVFISKYLFPSSNSSNFFEAVTTVLNQKLQGLETDYEVADNQTLKNEFYLIQREIMILLAIYGCVVIFSCSSYYCYAVTPFGLVLLTFIVLAFQIYAIVVYGRYKPSKSIFYFVIALMIVFFAVFVIGFPNLVPFSISKIVVCNILVLVNLILWVFLYVKEKVIQGVIRNEIYKLDVGLRIVSQPDVLNRLQSVVNERKKENSNNFYLFRQAVAILRDTPLYFKYDFESDQYTYVGDTDKKLKNCIEGSSFGCCTKKILCEFVKKNPKVGCGYKLFADIEKEKKKFINRQLKKLSQRRIVEKK